MQIQPLPKHVPKLVFPRDGTVAAHVIAPIQADASPRPINLAVGNPEIGEHPLAVHGGGIVPRHANAQGKAHPIRRAVGLPFLVAAAFSARAVDTAEIVRRNVVKVHRPVMIAVVVEQHDARAAIADLQVAQTQIRRVVQPHASIADVAVAADNRPVSRAVAGNLDKSIRRALAGNRQFLIPNAAAFQQHPIAGPQDDLSYFLKGAQWRVRAEAVVGVATFRIDIIPGPSCFHNRFKPSAAFSPPRGFILQSAGCRHPPHRCRR